VLFVREPRYGQGKRRLARALGDAVAARFAYRMLHLALRRLGRNRRWRLRLAVTPDTACSRPRLWPRRVALRRQGGGDLGSRMHRAIAECPSGPVVLIGNDIPALGPSHIAEAFRLLGRHDIVFGPATDGGFWLVGVRRRPRPSPGFGLVRWSSEHALADALANLPTHTSTELTALLEDVDDADAYRRLAPRRGF